MSNKKWNIYTKTGDAGSTALIGGKRVKKNHIRIEAYGTVDELIAYIGLIRDGVEKDELKDFLLSVQDKLMVCAAILATDCENCDLKLPELKEQSILDLENEIDKMEATLTPLTSFILPGGHSISSYCHIARTVCRRAERRAIDLSENYETDPLTIKYLNRLSDYLFVLARKIIKDSNSVEISWKPNL